MPMALAAAECELTQRVAHDAKLAARRGRPGGARPTKGRIEEHTEEGGDDDEGHIEEYVH